MDFTKKRLIIYELPNWICFLNQTYIFFSPSAGAPVAISTNVSNGIERDWCKASEGNPVSIAKENNTIYIYLHFKSYHSNIASSKHRPPTPPPCAAPRTALHRRLHRHLVRRESQRKCGPMRSSHRIPHGLPRIGGHRGGHPACGGLFHGRTPFGAGQRGAELRMGDL